MRLLWVRHGQMAVDTHQVRDARSIDRLFNQEVEGGLTERGRREATQVADRLEREGVDALVASHLLRAEQTGRVSADRLGLDLRITEDIGELRTGHLKKGSRHRRFLHAATLLPLPHRLKRLVVGPTLVPLYLHAWLNELTEGGESPAQLQARVDRALRELEARYPPDATVALFAHGYLLITLGWRLGEAARRAILRHPYIPNGAICEMVLRDGELRFVSHADRAHL